MMSQSDDVILDRPLAPRVRRFTLDDLLRWQAQGVLDPDERRELLDGEIIEMPSEGSLHKRYKLELGRFLTRILPDDLRCAVDSTLFLSPYDAPEPDIHVAHSVSRRSGDSASRVGGPDVLLLVEIADSSLAHDMKRKAHKYASFGVQEYWVIDLQADVTHVYGELREGRYGEPDAVEIDAVLRPRFLPGISFRLSDLPHLDVPF